MPGIHEQRSEVRRLLEEISAEYEAAQRGLSGVAHGVSQHRFITRRMESISVLHSRLHALIGHEAMELIAARLDQDAEDETAAQQECKG